MDYHLKPIMRSAESYIKDTVNFLNKLKELGSVPQNALLVKPDVVGCIPHPDGLDALSIKLEQQEDKKIPKEDLLEMPQFFLKNNYFEFNSNVKQQVSGTAIDTKFAPPYACMFMDRMETEFLEKQNLKPWVWFRQIEDMFFVWTHGEDKIDEFLESLNSFRPNLKFILECSEQETNFLHITVQSTGLYCEPTDCHQCLH